MIANRSSLHHHQHPSRTHAGPFLPQATPPSAPHDSPSSSPALASHSSPPHRFAAHDDELAASGRSRAPASAVNTTAPPPQQNPTQPRHRQHPSTAIGSAEIIETVAATPPPGWAPAGPQGETHAAGGGAARFPSPPSSSPAVVTDDAKIVSMASQTARHIVSLEQQQRSADAAAAGDDAYGSNPANSARHPRPHQQQPSPPSDDFQASVPSASAAQPSTLAPGLDVAPSPLSQPAAPPAAAAATVPQQTVIHIRDLAHVQSLARADLRAGHGSGILNDPPLQQMKYEISAMPIGDIIEMVAALLTKITTTNDLQHDAMQRNVAHQQQASQTNEASGSSQMSPLSHSVLAFHGKNVPAITILSYLSRIHKYCPTTYEVFLSLLVYFDRMTERVNELVTKSEEARRQAAPGLQRQAQQQAPDVSMRDDGGQYETADSDSDLADDDDDDDDEEEDDDEEMDDSPAASSREASRPPTGRSQQQMVPGPATYFVVDSFNIHRLIIAGVTCASKFFSDVFYTNSRYAKVGGLPLAELNHLELQFLVLNEFRLFVPVEDLEAYATMLVEFYAREVVGRQPSIETRD